MRDRTPKKPVKSIKKQLIEYSKDVNVKCCYCGKNFDGKRKISLDHVIPKSDGGKTIIGNLLVACHTCNSVKKKSLSLEEFIKLYPKSKYFIKKYLNKMKDCNINGKNYYDEIIINLEGVI